MSNLLATTDAFFRTPSPPRASDATAPDLVDALRRLLSTQDDFDAASRQVEVAVRGDYAACQTQVAARCDQLLRAIYGAGRPAPSFSALSELAACAEDEVREELGPLAPVFFVARQLVDAARPTPPRVAARTGQTPVSNVDVLLAASTRARPPVPPSRALPAPPRPTYPPPAPPGAAHNNAAAATPNPGAVHHSSPRSLPALASENPATLAHPVLASDGFFYERDLVFNSEVTAGGTVDCGQYPQFSRAEWQRLARAMPSIASRCTRHMLGATGAAYLRCSNRFEQGPSIFFQRACDMLAKGPVGRAPHESVVVRSAILSALHVVPHWRWHEVVPRLLELAEVLEPLGDDAPGTVMMLARWVLNQGENFERQPFGPRDNFALPPALRVAAAHAMGVNSLVVLDPETIFAGMEALYTLHPDHTLTTTVPRPGAYADEAGARSLATALCEAPPYRLRYLIDAVYELTGSTRSQRSRHATLGDCATLVRGLCAIDGGQTTPLFTIAGTAFHQPGSSHAIWDLLAAIDGAPVTTDRRTFVRDAFAFAAAYHRFGLQPLVELCSAAAGQPTERFAPAARLCLTLLEPAERPPGADVVACMNALLAFAPDTLAMLQENTGLLQRWLARDDQPRRRNLASTAFLQDFLRRRVLPPEAAAVPVAIRSSHRPHVDVETVMAPHRMANMRQDVATLFQAVPHNKRQAFTRTRPSIEAYLASPHAAELARQPRRQVNRLTDAREALAGLGSFEDLDMRRLCAAVWTAIDLYRAPAGEAQTTADQQTMRYSLACGLADCIEEDGHMVCIWGQGQNLLGALHGHGFALRGEQEALTTTPSELLTLVGSEFAQALAADGVEDPMPHEVEKFCRDAMLRAGQLLSAADTAPFRRRLVEYVELSGWAVPTF